MSSMPSKELNNRNSLYLYLLRKYFSDNFKRLNVGLNFVRHIFTRLNIFMMRLRLIYEIVACTRKNEIATSIYIYIS